VEDNMAIRVGEGEFRYELVEDWAQLPAGVDLADVSDIAIGADDEVYVFNRGTDPIAVFDRKGNFQRSIGQGVFTNPHGMYVADDGSVFGVDDRDHTVRELSPEGEVRQVLGTVGEPSDTGATFPGKYMSAQYPGGPFYSPTGLVIAGNGDMYVSDGYGNCRVHRFSRSGELKGSWGETGQGDYGLRLPHAITTPPAGDRLVVSDRENSRLQFFDLDGRFLDSWTDVRRPNRAAYDRDGYLYVAELGWRTGIVPCCDGIQMPPVTDASPPSGVAIYAPDGTVVCRWGSAELPCPPGYFFCAHGLAVDSQGDVYVCQTSAAASKFMGRDIIDCHRLQKFTRI
jgi:DNA-binding beta-propeller fold protein YncE